ncbi:GntR family transcriptional regulator [Kitasatospora griseola]|uniref:GntR family transcriptional regulator n=1 Tax=Kitasatospora griseola TaxID=2064 RepID=UPI00166F7880|nr:GntR family transcriptional regulator [Kitasatospora griseola]GGQ93312.1 hypothetical protein GCM10010195_56440 [Kitasatospora griseola]
MTDLDPTRPKWPQVAAELAARIERGDSGFTPGSMITGPMVQAEFGLAKATSAKVFTELRRRKLVRTEFGMGSFVTDQDERG